MKNNDRVRVALSKAREVAARQPKRVPALEAVVAVLNADCIDRAKGITFEAERTPGLALAGRIVR